MVVGPTPPGTGVMSLALSEVVDRIDNDVLPARAAGMRTVLFRAARGDMFTHSNLMRHLRICVSTHCEN
jgi:hypothetical protein